VLRAATYGRGIWQIPLVTAGIVPTTATATPASLSSPAQPEQTQSASQPVSITNTGSVALGVTEVSGSGDFAGRRHFVRATGKCHPTGTYTITVTGTAPGLSQSVQLTLKVE